MAEYILTNKAVEDLSRIWDYTYEVWSESQADNYYALLIEACAEIAEKPTTGRIYEEVSKEVFGWNVGKHILFYRQLDSKTVEIIRILHERMDLKNRLNK